MKRWGCERTSICDLHSRQPVAPVLRGSQHREHAFEGFTARYNVDRLVWYQIFGDMRAAIAREKQLKGWRREKKIQLIESENPTWQDLSEEWGKPIVLNDIIRGPAR
ncbi:MAG: GIY-YIG nuclease family protein [Candidatus Korobacteraceae bacterium]